MKQGIRNKRLEIRLTEKECLRLLKQSGGMDLSKYVRKKLFADGREDFIPDKKIEAELKRLNSEINRIGVNINQIVKNHNSGIYTEQDKAFLVQDMQRIKSLTAEYRKLIYQKGM